MRIIFLLLGLALVCPVCGLRAESKLQPSLGVVFPVREGNQQLVLTSPILLNINDVLPSGTVVHKVFPRPRPEDKDVKAQKAKTYNSDNYAAKQRDLIENRAKDKNKSAAMVAAEARASGDSMVSEMKFRAMLHRMNVEEYFLAYDIPGGNERRIGQFEFPEGLFLAEQEGRVVVLAVDAGSDSEKRGILPGSFVTALNGKPLKSLTDFRDRYFKEKEEKKAFQESLLMTVVAPGQTEGRQVEFQVKRSLGNMNDLMSDLDGTETTPGEPKKTGPAKTPEKEEKPLILIP